MPTFCKLFDSSGASISQPVPIPATISWRQTDGIAQAFVDGRVIAELHNATPQWIEAGGIRIVGMEPTEPGALTFRAQAWQYNPN